MKSLKRGTQTAARATHRGPGGSYPPAMTDYDLVIVGAGSGNMLPSKELDGMRVMGVDEFLEAEHPLLTHELGDDFLEKAQHTMLGDIDGFDDTAWFDDRDARSVAFEQRDAGVRRVLAGAPFRIGVAGAARICESVQPVASPVVSSRQLNRLLV